MRRQNRATHFVKLVKNNMEGKKMGNGDKFKNEGEEWSVRRGGSRDRGRPFLPSKGLTGQKGNGNKMENGNKFINTGEKRSECEGMERCIVKIKTSHFFSF